MSEEAQKDLLTSAEEQPKAKAASPSALDVKGMSTEEIKALLAALHKEDNHRERVRQQAFEQIKKLCDEHGFTKAEILSIFKV